MESRALLYRPTPSAMRFAPLLIAALLAGCSVVSRTAETALSRDDQKQIRALMDTYVAGWLAGDTLAVMRTLADDAVLQPGGMEPVHGHDAIRAFWWPDDGSRTTILSYSVRLDEVGGGGDVAYSRGEGTLSFRYEHDGSVSEITSTAVSLTIYHRQPDGTWRIARRMWAPLRS